MNVDVICNDLFGSTTNLIIPENNLNKEVWTVDCGDSDKVIEALKTNERLLGGILLTHGHFDHICGIKKLLQYYPHCKIYTNAIGKEMLLDARKNVSLYYGTPITIPNSANIQLVGDRENVKICGSYTAKAIFTPGHNPSCITWLIDYALFTGDAYIPGIKIVTNLPGGNKEQAEESLQLIKGLAVGKEIYPGHNISI